jgi:hypothetical protein
VTLLIVFALWSSYAISVTMGMSKSGAWWSSVAELAVMIVYIAVRATKRRRK